MFLKIKMKAHFPENVLFSLRELRLIAPLQQQSASNFCEAKRVLWPQKYNLLGKSCTLHVEIKGEVTDALASPDVRNSWLENNTVVMFEILWISGLL